MRHLQVAGSPVGERRVTKAQLLEQSCGFCYDFCFAELIATIDSPKIVFNMIMDAFQPFLGQYYQARMRLCFLSTCSRLKSSQHFRPSRLTPRACLLCASILCFVATFRTF